VSIELIHYFLPASADAPPFLNDSNIEGDIIPNVSLDIETGLAATLNHLPG
jgi:hypothetical protein